MLYTQNLSNNFYNPKSLNLQVVSFSSSKLEAKCKCPYHKENTPSAYFNIASGLFYCFGCGASKNIEQLALELHGTIEKTNFIIASNEREKEDINQYNMLSMALNNPYLLSRQLDNAMIAEFEIKENMTGVYIPIKNQLNVVVGYQERKTDGSTPKYIFHGDYTPVFPFNKASEFLSSTKDTVLIVEGVFGVFRARQYGLDAYAILGSSKVLNSIPFINACLSQNKKVITMFDNDDAGRIATNKLLLEFPNRLLAYNYEVDEADKAFFDNIGSCKFYRNVREYNNNIIDLLRV